MTQESIDKLLQRFVELDKITYPYVSGQLSLFNVYSVNFTIRNSTGNLKANNGEEMREKNEQSREGREREEGREEGGVRKIVGQECQIA